MIATAIVLGGAWLLAVGLLAGWRGAVGGRLACVPRRFRALRWVGITGFAVGSALEVAFVLARFTGGGFDAEWTAAYLAGTRHGTLVVARVACTLATGVALAFGAVRIAGVLFLGALVALSAASHAGAMGTLPFALDALHLLVALAWAAALGVLAFAPMWASAGEAARATARVSRAGPWLVAALAVSGALLTRLHVQPLSAVTTTGYGAALLTKLALVAFTLAFALRNRRALARISAHGAAPLQRGVRIEAALLAAVLVATAVLKTQPPAHTAAANAPAAIVHMRITPSAHATTWPPTQITPSAARSTLTRPRRPSAVPCAAT